MTDTLVLQASFLFFEAIFCFMVALYSFASNLSSEKKLRTTDLVTSLNALAGLLLLSDSMAYFFRGNPSALGYFMVRFSNGMVFLLSDVIMVGYTMYVTKQIFGHIGFGGKLPCSRRVRSCYTIGTIGILIVIINQFIGIYYSFDSNNIYHRGFLFPLALILPAVGVFLTGTIIIQYRKKMEIRRLISLLSYIVLMLIALIVQIFIYGYSFINISIGLGSIIVFMDTSISQKKEIERVAKVEIRTGLNNEYGCIQKINSLRDKSEIIGYTVIFFDLAKFSVINRKHGMKVGDQVLNNYSKELKKNVEKDEILGRQGSDYFIAVIKKRNLKKFLELIKEIPVEATSQITGKPLYFNISAVAGV